MLIDRLLLFFEAGPRILVDRRAQLADHGRQGLSYPGCLQIGLECVLNSPYVLAIQLRDGWDLISWTHLAIVSELLKQVSRLRLSLYVGWEAGCALNIRLFDLVLNRFKLQIHFILSKIILKYCKLIVNVLLIIIIFIIIQY